MKADIPKIIEELKGEIKPENDQSVISFMTDEIAESMKEIEKMKESLTGEISKNMSLQMEISEKNSQVEREKKENFKLNHQLSMQVNVNKTLEEQLKIKENNWICRELKTWICDLRTNQASRK